LNRTKPRASPDACLYILRRVLYTIPESDSAFARGLPLNTSRAGAIRFRRWWVMQTRRFLAEMPSLLGSDSRCPSKYFLCWEHDSMATWANRSEPVAPVFPNVDIGARTRHHRHRRALLFFIIASTSGLLRAKPRTLARQAVSQPIAGSHAAHTGLAIILVIMFPPSPFWLPSIGSGSGEIVLSWRVAAHGAAGGSSLAAIPGASSPAPRPRSSEWKY